jgi:transcriptional regulator with XRE-family HTH domain
MKNDETSMKIRLGVASNIRKIRCEQGYTQTAFAKMINANRSYFNQIECGKKNASIDMLVKIADGLDRPISDLFEGVNSDSPQKLDWESICCRYVSLPDSTPNRPSGSDK